MKKLLTNEVNIYLQQHGCELLSEYEGIHKSITFRCSCGGISNNTLHNFKFGQRCKRCGIIKRAKSKMLTYDFVKSYFESHKCVLLSTSYKGAKYKLNYLCSCGNESKITFGNFKAGHRCKNCSIRRGGENNKWNPDREAVALSEKFRKRCYNLLSRTLKYLHKRKKDKTAKLLGYKPSQLRDWIIRHPNWEEVKDKSWHLDHVFPIKAFIDYKIEDLKIINCLENLQPITAEENLNKQGIYSKKDFEEWLKRKGIVICQ